MPNTPSETILVVHDEPEIVKTVRAGLDSSGFRVVTAHDRQAALTVYHHENLSLVILDMGLRVLDGIDVTRTLRRDSDVPLIVDARLWPRRNGVWLCRMPRKLIHLCGTVQPTCLHPADGHTRRQPVDPSGTGRQAAVQRAACQ